VSSGVVPAEPLDEGPAACRTWTPSWAIDLRAILGPLRRGGGDPCLRVGDGGVWWATRSEDRPVTLHLQVAAADRAVLARAWGATAPNVLDELPRILGADDDVSGFVPQHDVVAEAWRRFSGWRVLCTGRVMESLAPAVLEQKVTGGEARDAWRTLVRAHGDRAPGPTPAAMFAPPTAAAWSQVPEWEWYRAGVTPHRRRTLVRAASVGRRLDGLAAREAPGWQAADRAGAALQQLPGVGPWTAAEVRQRAFGDPDTVSVGDFHLALQVSYGLTGERGVRGDDARMLELLEPYRGHRYRVQRLLELAGVSAPRRGPRYSPASRLAVMRGER
jgi:3-methyladenine DNA glycosylase/8-oxoguanine DNA glycosylase